MRPRGVISDRRLPANPSDLLRAGPGRQHVQQAQDLPPSRGRRASVPQPQQRLVYAVLSQGRVTIEVGGSGIKCMNQVLPSRQMLHMSRTRQHHGHTSRQH